MSDHETAAAYADRIEAALRETGLWTAQPPPPEAFAFRRAFAADTMSFPTWLQFVFLARIRQVVAEGGEFPASSDVAVRAARELDDHPGPDVLLDALAEFDDWIASR